MADQSVTKSTKKAGDYKYIGPDYKNGIQLNGSAKKYKPKDWDQKKINTMIKKDPRWEKYFSN